MLIRYPLPLTRLLQHQDLNDLLALFTRVNQGNGQDTNTTGIPRKP